MMDATPEESVDEADRILQDAPDLPEENSSHHCKWCGTPLNGPAYQCPNCHRGQRWIDGALGSRANLIAIVGVILTFGQLVMANIERRDAVQAAYYAQQALEEARESREQVALLKTDVGTLRIEASAAAHGAQSALLETRTIRTEIGSLTEEAKRQVLEFQGIIDNLQQRYQTGLEQLQGIPRQIVEVQERLEFSDIVTITPQATPTKPKLVRREVLVPNPAYEAKQLEIQKFSEELAEAEAKLSEALRAAGQR